MVAISHAWFEPGRSSPTAEGITQSTGTKKRFYLPEADGVRCIALLLVWFHHYPVAPRTVLIQLHVNGWIGVNVFLVLSSFLITSLLMLEAKARGTISLSGFYSRRFLRIWPLLGLALLLNYLLLPAIDYAPGGFRNPAFLHDVKYHAIPNLLLLGNWSAAIYSYLQYGFCNHLWTINLEEQFYLLWPLLLTYLLKKPRQLLMCCLGMVAISYLARYYYTTVGFKHPALWVSTITRLDPLALGGILAVVYPNAKEWLSAQERRISSLFVSVVLFALVIALTAVTLRNWIWAGSVWWKLGFADLFIMLAVGCVLVNPALSFFLRLPFIAWLGKISYGLYVYHKFIIRGGPDRAIHAFVLRITGGRATLWSWSLGMLISFLALVAISAVSYYFFERWFLKLKERFETVRSRPA